MSEIQFYEFWVCKGCADKGDVRMKDYYWSEELCEFVKVLDFPYPTEIELLKIFPEGKQMIREKITEWTEIKEKIVREEVRPRLKEIEAIKDDFSRWFVREVYKLEVNPQFTESVKQLERLNHLKILTSNTKHAKNIVNLEQKKEAAKQTPILSLYPFKKLRKLGSRHTALCPFHNEKTPSFTIYPNNTFHCFGCQKHGDAINFVQYLKKSNFKTALNQMTEGVV